MIKVAILYMVRVWVRVRRVHRQIGYCRVHMCILFHHYTLYKYNIIALYSIGSSSTQLTPNPNYQTNQKEYYWGPTMILWVFSKLTTLMIMNGMTRSMMLQCHHHHHHHHHQ